MKNWQLLKFKMYELTWISNGLEIQNLKISVIVLFSTLFESDLQLNMR